MESDFVSLTNFKEFEYILSFQFTSGLKSAVKLFDYTEITTFVKTNDSVTIEHHP